MSFIDKSWFIYLYIVFVSIGFREMQGTLLFYLFIPLDL